MKTSRIPRKAKRLFGGIFCLEYPSRRSEKEVLFRKLNILISQTTYSHFANCRFSFRKLQIFISFRLVSFRKVQ